MIEFEKAEKAAEYIKSRVSLRPEIGLILGSGLGFLANNVENASVLEYSEIPNFPTSTVEGHEGKMVIGRLFGKNVLALKGRFHVYEGYPPSDVAFPIYVMKLLGVERLVITNSSGGINTDFKPGDVVLIRDVINFAFRNPLIGKNDERFGVRFPDMSQVFDKNWMEALKNKLKEQGKEIKEGVYIWTLGPSYETPAEIKAFAKLGADMVGMSTVPEVIACAHVGIKVLGLSCITNMAAGILDEPLKHEDVIRVANMVKDKFARIVREALEVV